MHMQLLSLSGQYLSFGAVFGVVVPTLAEAVSPAPGLSIPYALLGVGIAIAVALLKVAHSMGSLSGKLSSQVDTLIGSLDDLAKSVENNRTEHKDEIKVFREENSRALARLRSSLSNLEKWKAEQDGIAKARRNNDRKTG